MAGENVPGMMAEKNQHLWSLCVCVNRLPHECPGRAVSHCGETEKHFRQLSAALCISTLFCSSKDVNKLTEGHNTPSNVQEGFLGSDIFLHFNCSGNDFVFQQLP